MVEAAQQRHGNGMQRGKGVASTRAVDSIDLLCLVDFFISSSADERIVRGRLSAHVDN